MRISTILILSALTAACSTSNDPTGQITTDTTEPSVLDPVDNTVPSSSCLEAGLESGDKCVTPAGLKAAIDEAVATAVTEAVAKATAEAAAACEAKTEGLVSEAEFMPTDEWAGVPVRMMLGVQLCQALVASDLGDYVRGAFLRKVQPGLPQCSKTCAALGCVDNNGTGLGSGYGYLYSPTQLAWVPQMEAVPGAYCCCYYSADSETSCAKHDLD